MFSSVTVALLYNYDNSLTAFELLSALEILAEDMQQFRIISPKMFPFLKALIEEIKQIQITSQEYNLGLFKNVGINCLVLLPLIKKD